MVRPRAGGFRLVSRLTFDHDRAPREAFCAAAEVAPRVRNRASARSKSREWVALRAKKECSRREIRKIFWIFFAPSRASLRQARLMIDRLRACLSHHDRSTP